MRRVLAALLAEIAVSALLLIWSIRMVLRAEAVLPLIGELPLPENGGLTPEMFGYLLIAASGAAITVAIWRLIPLVRQLWMSKALASDGVCVQGVVKDMHNVKVIQVNRTYSVRLTILCTAPSGQETEVKSPVIWAPEIKVGDAVDVIFDRYNEERYFIRLHEKKFERDSLRDQRKRRFL